MFVCTFENLYVNLYFAKKNYVAENLRTKLRDKLRNKLHTCYLNTFNTLK